MNDFEAHESSYDHQHKKRLLEMKQMQRQVKDSLPRKEERGPLMSIKLGGSKDKTVPSGGGGFKKGGFKKTNAFAPIEGSAAEEEAEVEDQKEEIKTRVEDDIDSDLTDQEDYYDPYRPSGCHPGCPSTHTKH